MMSPFIDPASPRLPHLTQFVSDDENYQDDTGFMYGTAIGQEMMKEPSVREGWLNRVRTYNKQYTYIADKDL